MCLHERYVLVIVASRLFTCVLSISVSLPLLKQGVFSVYIVVVRYCVCVPRVCCVAVYMGIGLFIYCMSVCVNIWWYSSLYYGACLCVSACVCVVVIVSNHLM